MPDVMDVVAKIKAPVQGHYGLLDQVAPAADVRTFEGKLKEQKTPAEMHYYAGAGHGFYDYSWRPEQAGAFGYNADAAKRARAAWTDQAKLQAPERTVSSARSPTETKVKRSAKAKGKSKAESV